MGRALLFVLVLVAVVGASKRQSASICASERVRIGRIWQAEATTSAYTFSVLDSEAEIVRFINVTHDLRFYVSFQPL